MNKWKAQQVPRYKFWHVNYKYDFSDIIIHTSKEYNVKKVAKVIEKALNQYEMEKHHDTNSKKQGISDENNVKN